MIDKYKSKKIVNKVILIAGVTALIASIFVESGKMAAVGGIAVVYGILALLSISDTEDDELLMEL